MLFALSQSNLQSDDANFQSNGKDHVAQTLHEFVGSPTARIFTKVTVVIGSTKQKYEICRLQQLSYFNSMLSKRWNKNVDITQPIKVLPSFLSNSNIDWQELQIPKHFQFGCNDLTLLLECVEKRKIPFGFGVTNKQFNLKTLESLLYCNDYLNSKSENGNNNNNNNNSNDSDDRDSDIGESGFELSQSMLINYFRKIHCDNISLHKNNLEKLLNECNHPLLRKSITSLRDETMKKTDKIVTNMLTGHLNNNSNNNNNMNKQYSIHLNTLNLSNIENLDINVASAILQNKLSLKCKLVSKTDKQIINSRMRINEYNNDDILCKKMSKQVKLQFDFPFISCVDWMEIIDNNKNNNNDYNYHGSHDMSQNILKLWHRTNYGEFFDNKTFIMLDKMIEQILGNDTLYCTIEFNICGKHPKNMEENNDNFECECKRGHRSTWRLISRIIYDIMDQLSNGEIYFQRTNFYGCKYINNVKSLLMSHILIYLRHESPINFTETIDDLTQIIDNLSPIACHDLFIMLCKFIDIFIQRNISRWTGCIETIKSIKLNCFEAEYYIELIKYCLKKCNVSFIIENLNLWFPILNNKLKEMYKIIMSRAQSTINLLNHLNSLSQNNGNGNGNSSSDENDNDENSENDDKEDESEIEFDESMIVDKIIKSDESVDDNISQWIFDNIVCRFGVQDKFNFGIYLSQYIVFDNANNGQIIPNKVPKLYKKFMSQQCGIDWDLV